MSKIHFRYLRKKFDFAVFLAVFTILVKFRLFLKSRKISNSKIIYHFKARDQEIFEILEFRESMS